MINTSFEKRETKQTVIAQKLPQDYEEKVNKFQCYVLAKRKEHKYLSICLISQYLQLISGSSEMNSFARLSFFN